MSDLLTWYHAHGRKSLPWRNTDDTYAIYISEVMLQQTQVATVLERYYFPFLKRFPTLQSLAEADLQDVLKMWEGLGYYTRARNLHKAAQMSAPHLPRTVEELHALPGIGRNTAHAIAAFAYHLPVPVMEANVKRVICRVFALEQPSEQQLWEKAFELLDKEHPFDYNQAMMDIGSYVCTKTTPACMHCPLNSICQGKLEPQRYPAAITKKATPVRKKYIVAFYNERKEYWLSPRTTRFLHGLYGFAEYDREEKIMLGNQEYRLEPYYYLGTVEQTYSHFKLEAEVYRIPAQANARNHWIALETIPTLPLSKADSKVVRLIEEALVNS